MASNRHSPAETNVGAPTNTRTRPLEAIPVLILAGGKGSRLAGVVKSVPKALAPVHGRPFLDILIERFVGAGFRRFVFATGHKSGQIQDYFAGQPTSVSISFSNEAYPLGTGGAIWNARPHLGGSDFVVSNGDSLCQVDYAALERFHRQKQAVCSMVLSRAGDARGYGSVSIDPEQRIIRFDEKPGRRPAPHAASGSNGWINSGIYWMDSHIFDCWTDGPVFSIERDFFPRTLQTGRLFGFPTSSNVLDIGTPERYARIQSMGL